MVRKSRLSAIASALLVIGAVRAQSDPVPGSRVADADRQVVPQEIALSMPTPAIPSIPAEARTDATAARAAIEKANSQWLSAFRHNDADSHARIYVPDASLFPATNAGLEGRDRSVECFQSQ